MPSIRVNNITFDRIEAIIFDKDGTLEDSQEFLRKLGQVRSRLVDAQIPGIGEPLLMAFGIENDTLDPTGLMATGTRQENEIATAAYIAETGRGWIESKNIAHKAFIEAENSLKNYPPSPLFVGSLELLKSLSEGGVKIGILSAATTEQVRAFVTRHKLDPYIQLQKGASENLAKPNPALFVQSCQELGVEPGKTLMVGDSAGDMQMAKEAGAAGAIGICWQPSSHDLPMADVVISTLDAIAIGTGGFSH